MIDLTPLHQAELLELSLDGLQAISEHSEIDPDQFTVLILLAMDVRLELARREKEDHEKWKAERARQKAKPSRKTTLKAA